MAELNIKTNQELIAKLEELAKRGLTPEEVEAQRLSFIFSGMPNNSGMSKLDIKRELKRA